MSEVVARSTSRDRFNMWLMTVFGAAALLLAAIGIYGLMAYSVAQRTQEIGIRLALGADAGQVRRMVVFQGLRLAIVGVVIGLATAFLLSRVLAAFLYGVTRAGSAGLRQRADPADDGRAACGVVAGPPRQQGQPAAGPALRMIAGPAPI